MDDADVAQRNTELIDEMRLRKQREKAVIPAGAPGDCDFCGEWTGRLVLGACAPCRDKLGLD
ncbi:hypothetical protein UFOVP1326_9 [uncultured Caudovirales phage]|uniref:Conjugal transfer protein TraR n=1 Tax=uncultured Caudovirales phage TaxID=2100421 RepID=A0A6J5RNN4_9CAUD|nr:hypothetical protein UFOVP1326_9 [uncultured Caudovirales phage]CAB4212726.1 hypothetical protein UFOVP1436_30 [uncultured Caudovirales phage]